MYTFVYVHMFVRMHVCLQLLCVRTTHVFTDLVNVSLLMIYLGTMLTTTIIQYILHTLSLKMILCDRFPDERSICDCYLIFACLRGRFVEARMRLHTGTRHYGR